MARGLKKGMTNNPGGRPRGVKNKLPGELKKKILAICDNLDKEGKGLEDCAREEPRWFYENFLKVLVPKGVEVSGVDGEPIETVLRVKLIAPSTDKAD